MSGQDYQRGASDTLAWIRRRLTHASKLGEPITDGAIQQILRDVAERMAKVECPTCQGFHRETVGMVCQACGRNYGPEGDA